MIKGESYMTVLKTENDNLNKKILIQTDQINKLKKQLNDKDDEKNQILENLKNKEKLLNEKDNK